MKVITSSHSGLRRSGRQRTAKSGARSATTPVADKPRSPFLDILDEVLPVGSADSGLLHDLWSDLPDAERSLLDHPSAENFSRYRELVKQIAAATIRANTRLRTMTRRGSKGQDLQLQVVEFIDRRLQDMAIMMQSPRNSAFLMLRRFEEIRGMLLDVRE